jgi:hypothetical protein
MKKVFFAATSLILVTLSVASTLLAQASSPSAPRSISKCSSGLRGGGPDCAPDRRLLVAVTMNGTEPSAEVLTIVGMAASSSGAFALTSTNATPTDSTIYAVMSIRRDSQGNYRLDRSMMGSKVTSPDNCRGYSTGTGDDMGFGAYLALETQKLVRCVQAARGAPTH